MKEGSSLTESCGMEQRTPIRTHRMSAWMNGSHRRARQVRMRFHRYGLLGMILGEVFIHLIDRQRFSILKKKSQSVIPAVKTTESMSYLIISEQPHPRHLIILVVRDAQIVSSSLDNVAIAGFRGCGGGLVLSTMRQRLHCILKRIFH